MFIVLINVACIVFWKFFITCIRYSREPYTNTISQYKKLSVRNSDYSRCCCRCCCCVARVNRPLQTNTDRNPDIWVAAVNRYRNSDKLQMVSNLPVHWQKAKLTIARSVERAILSVCCAARLVLIPWNDRSVVLQYATTPDPLSLVPMLVIVSFLSQANIHHVFFFEHR